MKLINELLLFILMISKKYNIDESHDTLFSDVKEIVGKVESS